MIARPGTDRKRDHAVQTSGVGGPGGAFEGLPVGIPERKDGRLASAEGPAHAGSTLIPVVLWGVMSPLVKISGTRRNTYASP